MSPPHEETPERSAPEGCPEADLSRVRTVPVGARPNKVLAGDYASPPPADPAARGFGAFLGSLPRILQAEALLQVVDAVAAAVRGGRAVVWMLGGHVVKTGLAPVIVDLMKRGAATHLASNGSAAIHDYEMARWGGTSEDVEAGLRDGSSAWRTRPGADMNRAFRRGMERGWGMGEALARDLDGRGDLAFPELSLLLQSHRLGGPVHHPPGDRGGDHPPAPAADGAAIGDTGHRDFRRLAAALPGLDGGGVVLNVGSAVIMPEVFLKALTVARNLDGGGRGLRHLRPGHAAALSSAGERGGASDSFRWRAGFQITGHHEIMVPLLAWAIAEKLDSA